MPGHFTAPRWLRSGHLQTLGAALPLWSPPETHRGIEASLCVFDVGEGGNLHCRAWWQEGTAPTALLLHGIGGSSESRYMMRGAVALHRAGYHVLRVNLRGAGEGLAGARSLYHAGLTEDVRRVVEIVSGDRRVKSIVLLGFSGGGSIALKLAGEWGDLAPKSVRAVASISAPLDYVGVSRQMERLRTLPYRRWVLGNLVEQALAFAKLHPARAPYDPAAIRRTRTFHDYDGSVIVPMHGFDSVRHYHQCASSGPYLSAIRVPTLIVHAEDDPMVPAPTVLPWIESASRAVRFSRSARGGHIGWIAGWGETRWVKTWAMEQVLTFLAEIGATID